MSTVGDVAAELGRAPSEVLTACESLGIVASSAESGLSSIEHRELRAALGAPADLPPVTGGSHTPEPGAAAPVDNRSLLDRHAELVEQARAKRRRWDTRTVSRIVIGACLLVAVGAGIVALRDRVDEPVSVLGFTPDDEGTCHDVDESGGPILTEVECDGPHDVELFAVAAVDEEALAAPAGADSEEPGTTAVVGSEPELDFPGTLALVEQAEDVCAERFEEILGHRDADSDLSIALLVPTAESWAAGDRAILCLAEDADGPLREPLAGSEG